MRKLLMAVLLAGAASPALAQPVSEIEDLRAERSARAEARAQRRAEMEQSREERAERGTQSSRGSEPELVRPARTRPAVEELRPSRTEQPSAETPGERAQRRVAGDRLRDGPAAFERRDLETPGERAQRRVAGDTVRNWRARERLLERPDSPALVEQRNLRRGTAEESGSNSIRPREVRPTISEGPVTRRAGVRPAIIEAPGADLVQQRERLPRTFDPSRRPPVSATPRFGTEPPPPATASTGVVRPEHRWRHDWRRDGRYDWRDWRSRHRSLFHLGFYYDPFGWNYMRYGIGWRMWPSYYRSSFWLSDPFAYRLPRSYGPYRWIRYHGDALLVNLYTGEVVDVVYDFFW